MVSLNIKPVIHALPNMTHAHKFAVPLNFSISTPHLETTTHHSITVWSISGIVYCFIFSTWFYTKF